MSPPLIRSQRVQRQITSARDTSLSLAHCGIYIGQTGSVINITKCSVLRFGFQERNPNVKRDFLDSQIKYVYRLKRSSGKNILSIRWPVVCREAGTAVNAYVYTGCKVRYTELPTTFLAIYCLSCGMFINLINVSWYIYIYKAVNICPWLTIERFSESTVLKSVVFWVITRRRVVIKYCSVRWFAISQRALPFVRFPGIALLSFW